MEKLNRREFVGHAAAVAGALALGTAVSAAPERKITDKVAIGKTGIKTSLVGIGTGTHGWNKESDLTRAGQDNFNATIKRAYDSGIRLFDCADMYGTHPYLKTALKGIPRERYTIETKIINRDPKRAKEDIERFRQELGVDYLDIVLMHVVTEGDWNKRYRGVMDVLEEAKQKKLIRAHGCSFHSLEALKTAVDEPWVDTVLARFNPWGAAMDGSPADVKPVLASLKKAGKGVVGMKILAEGKLPGGADPAARVRESIKFGLASGVLDSLVIGMANPDQVTTILQHTRLALESMGDPRA